MDRALTAEQQSGITKPVMDQIRTVLDDYTRRGGSYEEIAVEGSGHVPFLTHQDEFNRVFHAFLERNT